MKEEKDKVKQKRYDYRRTLDQQIEANTSLKNFSSMNTIERDINKNDLNSYLHGDKRITSMLPGIKSNYNPETDTPQKKSSLNSDYNTQPPGTLLSTEFQEK